jgi:hypothetical protein
MASNPRPDPAAHHVVQSARRDALAGIRQPGINLAIWQRAVPGAVAAEIAGLDLCGLPEVRLAAPADALAPPLAAAMAAWAAPALMADVLALAAEFAAIMATPAISVRLEAIAGDACRRWHADYVTARLIATYLGPGTDWLPDGAGEGDARRLPTGAVAMFKGHGWAPEAPIIHRSPPIAGTGQQRLVLVLNPAA